jgi:hypothetical protein
MTDGLGVTESEIGFLVGVYALPLPFAPVL